MPDCQSTSSSKPPPKAGTPVYKDFEPESSDVERVIEMRRAVWGQDHPHNSVQYYRWVFGSAPATVARPERGWGNLFHDNEKVLSFTGIKALWFLFQGERVFGVHGMDFMVHPDYQKGMLGARTARKWNESVKSKQARLGICFPNTKSLGVLVSRMCGWDYVVSPLLCIRPLVSGWSKSSFNPLVRAVGGLGGSIAGLAGDAVLQAKRSSISGRAIVLDRFDDSFDHLWELMVPELPEIALVRNAEYLNWRYFKNPLYEYQTIAWEQEGKVAAAWVLGIRDYKGFRAAFVVDVLGSFKNRPVHTALMKEAVLAAKRNGCQLMVSWAIAGSSIFQLLKSAGFLVIPKKFDPKPFNICVHRLGQELPETLRPDSWHFMVGDTDVA